MATQPCPHCGKPYDTSSRIAGDVVLCLHCNQWFRVVHVGRVINPPPQPKLSPTMLDVLRRLRDTRCTVNQEVTITEYPQGGASIMWHNGFEAKSKTVRTTTLASLIKLGMVEVRTKDDHHTYYGLSANGRAALQRAGS